MCSVPDKTITINCAMNVVNICDVLICFCFLFSPTQLLPLFFASRFVGEDNHRDVCIQPAAFGDKKPARGPASLWASLRLLLLVPYWRGLWCRRVFLLQEMMHHNALLNFVFFYWGPNLKTEIGYKSPLYFEYHSFPQSLQPLETLSSFLAQYIVVTHISGYLLVL